LRHRAESEWRWRQASGLAIVARPVEAFVEIQLTITKHGDGVEDADAGGHDAPSETSRSHYQRCLQALETR
jgi:hypothetical protein